MYRLLYPLLCSLLFLLAACAGEDATPEPKPEPYPPTQSRAEAQASVDQLIVEAGEAGKLAMLVLGANWCHDSTDFAAMLEEPGLAAWLDEHYVIGLFNLGYLDQMDTFLAPFDVPTLYGTPTVLVVDPATRAVRNPVRHYYWRNASLMTADDARNYFSTYLAPPEPEQVASAGLTDALAQIDDFEARQAQRISSAYLALGPLLEQYADGDPPEEFEAKWENLAEMRGQITKDLKALRASAREQDAAGVATIELEFPEYSLFIDT